MQYNCNNFIAVIKISSLIPITVCAIVSLHLVLSAIKYLHCVKWHNKKIMISCEAIYNNDLPSIKFFNS